MSGSRRVRSSSTSVTGAFVSIIAGETAPLGPARSLAEASQSLRAPHASTDSGPIALSGRTGGDASSGSGRGGWATTWVTGASVSLPISGTAFNSQLQASCNFIPGIPSRNSLFFGVSGSTTANIWGLAPGTALTALQALGWDTVPIDPRTRPAKLTVLPGGRHLTALEQPDAVVAALGSVLP